MKNSFLVALLCLAAISLAIGQTSEDGTNPVIIDATRWNQNNDLLALTGKFTFFENQLLTPQQCKNTHGTTKEFPLLFDGDKQNPGMGFATYYIRVAVSNIESQLAISIPQVYSCYKLWINDSLITETGVVGKTKETTLPQWEPKVLEFRNSRDTISIVLQIANFHHAKGGIKENIFLGTEDNIMERKRISQVANLSETIILFLIGTLFLIVFISSQRKAVAFYYAMLCLTWATRSMFANHYLFIQYFPDTNWNLLLRIEYICLYLTIIWSSLFVTGLYKNESNPLINYALVICNLLFVLFSLFTSPRTFTAYLNIYLLVSLLLILYVATVIIHAWINEQIGSSILSASIFIGVLIFGYDMLVFEFFASYNDIIFSLGYISIFSLIGLALALKINLIQSNSTATTELTYDNMFKNKE